MPDLSILIQIADYYDVDLKEILNGERKRKDMDKEEKETLRWKKKKRQKPETRHLY